MSDKKIQNNQIGEESKISHDDMQKVLESVMKESDSNDPEIKKTYDQL